MPSLNYKTGVIVTGRFTRPAEPRFYDGSTPDRTLVRCSTCERQRDPLFPHDATTPGCARLGRELRALRAELKQSERMRPRRRGKR